MKYLARLLLLWEKFKALENIRMERKALLDNRGQELSTETDSLREEMVAIKNEAEALQKKKNPKDKDHLAELSTKFKSVQEEINKIEGVKGQKVKADIIEKELSAIFNTLKANLWK